MSAAKKPKKTSSASGTATPGQASKVGSSPSELYATSEFAHSTSTRRDSADTALFENLPRGPEMRSKSESLFSPRKMRLRRLNGEGARYATLPSMQHPHRGDGNAMLPVCFSPNAFCELSHHYEEFSRCLTVSKSQIFVCVREECPSEF